MHPAAAVEVGAAHSKIIYVVDYVVSTDVWICIYTEVNPISSNGKVL